MVMTKTSLLKADPTPWLLELDNPSVRYFTLTDLLERPQSDAEVRQAKAAIMTSEPVQKILDAQYPDGHWIKPGIGYSPKYRATVWQVIFLADLGATRTAQIEKACEHIFEHAQRPDGAFIANKGKSGAIICLNGNLLRSLLWFGCGDDPRGQLGLDWLAARVHGDGGFCCHYNGRLPCAWGAVKALSAFAALPEGARPPAIQRAIERGVEFLLSYDLVKADYPSGHAGVSPLWFRFGFPLTYVSNILETLSVLTRFGHGRNPRLAGAIEFMLSKQDEEGRWPLEYSPAKTWARFGQKGQPSKWITLNALRVLKALTSPTRFGP
ncbi:MAG: nitrogen fixation protein NifH [Anaerolineales bacterium]|nr:MAG: nitrogen fixation protein NifH [Anaerolineales bacterium]